MRVVKLRNNFLINNTLKPVEIAPIFLIIMSLIKRVRS